MSKVIYFGVPAHGHTNPSLPVIQELVRRGEHVRFYSFPEFKEKVINTGAEYFEYRGFPPLVDNSLLVKSFVVLVSSLIKTTNLVVENLIEDINEFKPDYIIHDSISIWGNYAAKVCSIQTVTSISTFVFSKDITSIKDTISFILGMSFKDIRLLISSSMLNRKIANRLAIKQNDFLSNLMNLSGLNICYTVKELQPKSEKLDPAKFKFVGPSINYNIKDKNEFDYEKLAKPIIYIALGTILNSEKFFMNCGKALQNFDGTAIFSVGSTEIISKIKEINSNFIVRKMVNQLNVLSHTDLFITHGGMNSVHESLMLGVPLAVFPFQTEQKSVTEAVVRNGCGVQIKRNEINEIYKAVQAVLCERKFKQNCLDLSKSFEAKGGFIAAVNEIEKFKIKYKIQ